MLKKEKRHEILAVSFFIFFFTTLYTLLSVIHRSRFDSFAYDLGIYDQIIWEYSRFKIPYSSIKEKIIFGDHFTPTLVLLAPLYWIWDSVSVLLVFQAFWVSLSAFGFLPWIFYFWEKEDWGKFTLLSFLFLAQRKSGSYNFRYRNFFPF